ncbi:unnamed protein product [Heligmosomoides polygyrus]|uniref:GRIP domain-containing protein n=1 Tax=Heligmosomoides polygyrus TaxID=6339 RepID=A0A183GNS1_HELPZ|nr:unnamed protein product [Heligmosomoides polygyrus]
MEPFNWREESTLSRESDISDDSGAENADGDASAATLVQDVSIGTPVGQGDVTNISGSSKEPSSVPSIGRLSLSQPVLPVNATPPTRLNMSTGNISASLGKPPRAPLWKTLEENKELRQELAFLKYYSLQLSKWNTDEERKHIQEEKRQMKMELEAVEISCQTKIEVLEGQLREAHRNHKATAKELDQYKERVQELEAELARMNELPTLDCLKGDDSDWTLQSEGDIIAEQLRKQLTESEKEIAVLRRTVEEQQKQLEEKVTFVVGEGCDVDALLQRVDHLEARLREEEEERNKTSSALVVERIRDVLRSLGKQNRELRKECTLLLGLNDQSGISTNTTQSPSTPKNPDARNAVLEKSLLFNEVFEKKQQEIFDSLKTLTKKAKNLDTSLLDALRSIEVDEAGIDEEERLPAGLTVSEAYSPGRTSASFHRTDVNNSANLSMMNASLVELMGRSLNTSKDIADFKGKLLSFHAVMKQMFENLKSSGVLFEDVLEMLGSDTEEMRVLTEKIRAMKLAWNSAANESRVFLSVVEDTVHSVSRMQLELSAWEQSINETSFRLDVSMAQMATTQCFSAQMVPVSKDGA